MLNWKRAVFLHIGWTDHYDGTEVPEGGHAYLRKSVGVESENFKPTVGWCYGYAPVARTSKGRDSVTIPKGHRTLKIDKLGAGWDDAEIGGITVIWTARRPYARPVIVGLYENATVFRFMGSGELVRPFIAKARSEDCHLVPPNLRTFEITQKRKGFPGMAAAWFPGLHAGGPARDMLAAVATYLREIRRYDNAGTPE